MFVRMAGPTWESEPIQRKEMTHLEYQNIYVFHSKLLKESIDGK